MLLEKESNRNECFKVRIPHTFIRFIDNTTSSMTFDDYNYLSTPNAVIHSLSFDNIVPRLSVLLFNTPLIIHSIRRYHGPRTIILWVGDESTAYSIRLHLADDGVGARNIDTHTRFSLLFSLLAQERLLSSHLSPSIPSLSSTFRAACALNKWQCQE